MVLSMTGFGKSLKTCSSGAILVEIQSVNRKLLDIQLHLPKDFHSLDIELRRFLSEKVRRGQLTIRLYFTKDLDKSLSFELDRLVQLQEKWVGFAKELGYSKESVDLSFLMERALEKVEENKLSEEDLAIVRSAFEEAFHHWSEMRRIEGDFLKEDLKKRLYRLQALLEQIETLSPQAVIRLKEKFLEKIQSLSLNLASEALDEMIRKELFLFAEKIDIAEEVARLKSHFSQFFHFKDGKRMEFLLQEIAREINTIGSKSQDASISHLVVEMKAEVERMREQLQNIE